jgi:hypothetical protein
LVVYLYKYFTLLGYPHQVQPRDCASPPAYRVFRALLEPLVASQNEQELSSPVLVAVILSRWRDVLRPELLCNLLERRLHVSLVYQALEFIHKKVPLNDPIGIKCVSRKSNESEV